MKSYELITIMSVIVESVMLSSADRIVSDTIQTQQTHRFEKTHEHNAEFDHDAFLGRRNARIFEKLTPQESKKRLSEIFEKIDKDHDSFVSIEELKLWINYAQHDFIWEDVEREFVLADKNPRDGYLSWKELKRSKYGKIETMDPVKRQELELDFISRDERRFKRADGNKDGKLSPEEVALYLYPEHHDSVRDVYVQETLEDLDIDNNGYLSEDEYIGDIWPIEERANHKDEEPFYVKEERKKFQNTHDKNKDGRMDREEITEWILPKELDEITPETSHLIIEADANHDGRLSKKEMLDHYELFVGSEATHGRIGKTFPSKKSSHTEL